MDMFSMWDERIIFANGWFIYMDGKGNNSIISHTRAREIERGYQRYQARMDVDRGGMHDEIAFSHRGFVLEDGDYVYKNFRVDKLIVGEITPITSVLIIPESINGISINCIAKQAFKSETIIKKVVVHNNIKEIGESAFAGCINLEELELSNDHIIIKTDAFKDTAIYNSQDVTYLNNTLVKVNPELTGILEVKSGTTAIADEAFKDCSLITEVILPEGLISLGRKSFCGCKCITHLELPGSLATIETYAFADCTELNTVTFPKTMKKIGMAAFDGCTSLKSISLPEGITEIERAMFNKCENLFEVHIPKSVTKILFDAFTDCGLFKEYENSSADTLYIENWLIHYKWKEIRSLCVREGTVGIAGMDNWINPTNLCSIKLPNSLKYIGSAAFEYAHITSIDLPSELQYIGASAFSRTPLKNIVIPASVKKIEEWVFSMCEHIESITFKGANTEVSWPFISGRRDKQPIEIRAPKASNIEEYCLKWAQKKNLIFKPL